MDIDLPYLLSHKKFPDFLAKLQTAAVPKKMTANILKKLGFPSSNDRAFIALLKKLGFLNENGQPTERYGQYRDRAKSTAVLAEGIGDAYSELLDVNTSLYDEDLETIKSAVSSVTGREQKFVNLIAHTFKMLCENAEFSADESPPESSNDDRPDSIDAESEDDTNSKPPELETNRYATRSSERSHGPLSDLSFNYNIEIHLPATTDIAVYNAIFKSLRETLGEGR